MKLRNKKTGGLANIDELCVHTDAGWHDYYSLAELNEEWEDYKTPEGFWNIEWSGAICHTDGDFEAGAKLAKEIGNYFETKEEAEKVVEKLKAWKRLKDYGCGFLLDDHFEVKFVGPDARKITSAEKQKLLSDAYKMLFGGEE